MTETCNRDQGWHILWLGAGFSRDFGLPLFSDFLQHTELLYSYEGLIPPIQRKTLDGKMMAVPLADAKRKEQPTDKEDKKALKTVLDFRDRLTLQKKDKFNLEKIFMKAVKNNNEKAKTAIMRIVVRTFDLALHYRYRDSDAFSRVYSSEIAFWGKYPVLHPWERKKIYDKFFEFLGKPKGNVAIITVNWDAAIFEIWSEAWAANRKISFPKYQNHQTVSLPGYLSRKKFPIERTSLSEILCQGLELPHKPFYKIFYLPLHGAVNLLTCPLCFEDGDAVFVGGQVHNYKYRENYNVPGWSIKCPSPATGNWYHMNCCKHPSLPLVPVLSPPTEKQNVKEHSVLGFLWRTADSILNDIQSIHFIGTSFPETDIEVKKLLYDKLKKIDRNNKCVPISVTLPKAYCEKKRKTWGGYSLVKDFRCIQYRKNLQHFISEPPIPFNG